MASTSTSKTEVRRGKRLIRDNGGRSESWMKSAGESRGTGRNPQPSFQVERHDVFGFTDLKQYRNWFTPDQRQRLGAAGFQLVRYRVPVEAVKFDRAQMAAKNDAARERLGAYSDQPRVPAGQPDGGEFAAKA